MICCLTELRGLSRRLAVRKDKKQSKLCSRTATIERPPAALKEWDKNVAKTRGFVEILHRSLMLLFPTQVGYRFSLSSTEDWKLFL